MFKKNYIIICCFVLKIAISLLHRSCRALTNLQLFNWIRISSSFFSRFRRLIYFFWKPLIACELWVILHKYSKLASSLSSTRWLSIFFSGRNKFSLTKFFISFFIFFHHFPLSFWKILKELQQELFIFTINQ